MIIERYNETVSTNIDFLGFCFEENQFEWYLQNRVKYKFEDTEWAEMLTEAAVESTGFSSENFTDIFQNRDEASSWRIGELLAECILEDFFHANFYYNSTRDAKNFRSCLPGADLVGICTLDNTICFLFGEVKTSDDQNTPPNVVYGKTGMIHQLETLRDDRDKRNYLVKWLFSKSIVAEPAFKEQCAEALRNYVENNIVHLVGVLVRDTPPSVRDLRARAIALNNNTPTNIKIRLMALYSGISMQGCAWEGLMNGGETA